jgi:hypothetical protein
MHGTGSGAGAGAAADSHQQHQLQHQHQHQNLSHAYVYDLFAPMREHLLSQLRRPSPAAKSKPSAGSEPSHLSASASASVSASVSVSLSSSLPRVLHLFQRVCTCAPSLLPRLPEEILCGCPQLAAMCLSFSDTDPDMALLAASVLSQVVMMGLYSLSLSLSLTIILKLFFTVNSLP